MTNSMAASMLLSDLILNKPNQWQDVYSPSRHTIMASAKTFVVENANVAKELIKGKLENIPDNIEIKNDEGKIVNIDNQRAGAYATAKQMHIIITKHHSGQRLIELCQKTWDCPCHVHVLTLTAASSKGLCQTP
jgi:hypothetical protein